METEAQHTMGAQRETEAQRTTEAQRGAKPQQGAELQQTTEPQRGVKPQQGAELQQTTEPQRIHFIGVGGVGMSGIARVAADQGMCVSGSDIKESRYTRQLREAGISVSIGHAPENIPEGEVVVVISTAILANNPELIEAKRRGLEIIHRAQMLARLGEGLDTLAVTGTHGKTTTSAMLAHVLESLSLAPTFLVGGIVRTCATNAHRGTGRYYVVEADESDKSFTYLHPRAVLITNIEADHLDHYRDLNEIYAQFAEFIASVPEDGAVVVCGDDEALVHCARAAHEGVRTYGFGANCDVQLVSWEQHGVKTSFCARFSDGREISACLPQSPGKHNALNAAGVLALIDALGINCVEAARSLESFEGVKRRFELVGETAGVTVVDDYAHHPTEIAATIAAARALDFGKVHVLFQPHRYSRAPLFCEVLHDEFGGAFDAADSVTFMDVFPAGEVPVPGVSGQTFLDVVLDHKGHPDASFVPRRIDVAPHMAALAQAGDLIITMGAGDVTSLGEQILDALEQRDQGE